MINMQVEFPEHDGRCDLDGCDQPARFAKLAGSSPMLWNEGAPAASVGFYCTEDHANREPTARREDADAAFLSVSYIPSVVAWARLLAIYPRLEEARPV